MKKYIILLFLTTVLNGQNNPLLLGMFDNDVVVPVIPPDTIPSSFNFTDLINVNFSTEYTSDSIIATDFDSASISISAGSYRQGVNGNWETAQSMAYVGDTIWVKNTSSSSCTTAVNSVLTIGGVSDTYSITTVADTVLTSFSFTDKTNAALSTEYTSDSMVVGGIACDASIYISSGTYRKGALGSFTATQGTVSNGDTVWVKNTSSGSYATAVSCTLTVGGISDIYSITTISVTYDSSISTPLASSDDGFYKPAYTDIAGTKLNIGGSSGSCSFAIRFRGITIPNGATIDSARLYLYGGGEYSATTVTQRIYGEDVDSIGVFIGDDAGADFNTRDNTLTTAYVADTNMPTWSTNTLYTYVVTSIVSELVATRNYTNEAMGIFVIDQGSGATANRRCWSYDNGSLYPILKIYFHY